MEYLPILGLIVVLNTPIYGMLFNIQRRLTKVEEKVKYLYKKNGGEKE